MANITELKNKAAAIKSATVPESVSASQVGGLFEDVIDFAGQAATDVEEARVKALTEIEDRSAEEDARLKALERQMNGEEMYEYGYKDISSSDNTSQTNTGYVSNIDNNRNTPKKVVAITFKAKTGTTSFYRAKYGTTPSNSTFILVTEVTNSAADDKKIKTIAVDVTLADGECIAISGDYYYKTNLGDNYEIKYTTSSSVSTIKGRNEAYYLICSDTDNGIESIAKRNEEEIADLKETVTPLENTVSANSSSIDSINKYVGGPRIIKYSNLDLYSYGYISNNVIHNASSHCLVKLQLGGIDCITITTKTQTTLTFVTIRDANDGFVKELKVPSANVPATIDTKSYDNTYYALLSWYDYADSEYCDEATITYSGELDEHIDKKLRSSLAYKTMVRKPFVFNGKKILFCGDSITRGYTSGSTTTQNGYPKLFSDAVGATYVNAGVGGTTMSISDNGSIQTQIQAGKSGGYDYLFVAGGINDWQLGVSLDTFKSAIETICNYINSNYPQTTMVVFITPINHAGWETTHTLSLVAEIQDYRDIITRVVMEKDTYMRFSVIQGTDFNFPTKDGDSEYINKMFGDLLHPSQLGYNTLYLAGLLNALL